MTKITGKLLIKLLTVITVCLVFSHCKPWKKTCFHARLLVYMLYSRQIYTAIVTSFFTPKAYYCGRVRSHFSEITPR